MVHFHFTLSLRDGPSIVKLDFYFPQYAMWMNIRVRAIGLCLKGPLVGVHIVFYDISLIWGGLDPRALGFRVELDIHTYTRQSNYTCPLIGYQRVLLARTITCPCPVYGYRRVWGREREGERPTVRAKGEKPHNRRTAWLRHSHHYSASVCGTNLLIISAVHSSLSSLLSLNKSLY